MIIFVKINLKLTESPTSLNECNVGVVDEKRNGTVEKIGFWPEISVENGDVFTVFDIVMCKSFFESSCLVASPAFPNLVPAINAFACPSLAFLLDHILQLLIWLIMI
jgi:hypothetical protein